MSVTGISAKRAPGTSTSSTSFAAAERRTDPARAFPEALPETVLSGAGPSGPELGAPVALPESSGVPSAGSAATSEGASASPAAIVVLALALVPAERAPEDFAGPFPAAAPEASLPPAGRFEAVSEAWAGSGDAVMPSAGSWSETTSSAEPSGRATLRDSGKKRSTGRDGAAPFPEELAAAELGMSAPRPRPSPRRLSLMDKSLHWKSPT